VRTPRLGAVAAGVGLLCWPACNTGDDASSAAPTTVELAPSASLVELSGRPSAVVLDRNTGVLWVADDEAGVVHRLAIADGSTVGTPAVVSAHPTAVDAADGVVWVADPDGTVTRLDADTGEQVGDPIAVGGVLVDILADGSRVWVADIEASAVRAIDAATGEVGPAVTVPAGVVRMAVAGPLLWVSGLDAEVTPIERATGAVGSPVAVGNGPIGIGVDEEGTLWVANSDDATVSRVSGADGEPIGPALAVGPAPVDVAVVGDDVWVLDQDGPSLTRLDVRTGRRVGAPIALPLRPRGLAASASAVWAVGVDPSGVAWVG